MEEVPGCTVCRVCRFLLMLLLAGCQEDIGVDGTPIDSRLAIDIREQLSPSGRKIQMDVQTERIYPCANYHIKARQSKENKYRIRFTGIEEADFCQMAVQPARIIIDLGKTEPGEYPVELINTYLFNKGRLVITESDISLRFPITVGIELVRTEFRRVPPKTWWGRITYLHYDAGPRVEELKVKLESLGAVFEKQAPGDYVYYRIGEDGAIKKPSDAPARAEDIIFRFDGDEKALMEHVGWTERLNRGHYLIELHSDSGMGIYNSD